MTFRKNLTITVLVLISLVQTSVQAQDYLDANNLSEASGMLRARLVGAGVVVELCERDFPNLGAVVSQAVAKWKSQDEQAIAAADKFVLEMIRSSGQDPTPMLDAHHRRMTNDQFLSLDHNAQRQYCTQFADELLTGVWHRRTPSMYRLLDEYAKQP